MGFGNFLKKMTLSPFKATRQLFRGNVKGAIRTGVTGDGTAPLSPRRGGASSFQSQIAEALGPPRGGGTPAPPGMGQMPPAAAPMDPIMADIGRMRRQFDFKRRMME